MDEKASLRRSDFITSIILILFGVFVILVSTGMPMKASYGGVETHWYVAPALFPLFIGGGVILLGVLLMGTAVRQGGLASLLAAAKRKTGSRLDERTVRTMVVFLSLITFVYLFIPRIDFMISIMFFLSFVCTVFYAENKRVFTRVTFVYILECAVLVLFYISPLARLLNGLYVYSMDFMALLFLVFLYMQARKVMKRENVPLKKLRTVLFVAVLTPLFLCPVFRYALLVPLPKEGLLIGQMNYLYYSLKY
ncbi:MAG: hypothetical protein JW760_02235 [Spirochaetales bacterium]|nr:hypothetical protein [Spirochaetales bacterium]